MNGDKGLVEAIVAQAMTRAQAAQAVVNRRAESDVQFEHDRLKSAAASQRTEITVRVIVDGKVGASSTTDPADIEGVVARALEAAEFGSPAHFEMPGPAELAAVATVDPELRDLARPEMIALGQSMMEMVKASNPAILAAAGVNKAVRAVAFANSSGTAYTAEHTDFSLGAGGELVRGSDILYAGHGLAQKRRLVDTEEIADRAIQYFRMAERIAPVASGELPVIFTPGGSIALLLSLGLGLDGKNALLGASPLAGKLGQQIAHPSFTLIDDPTIDYGPGSAAFDDEGVARKPLTLVENGVLRNFIYDLDTAGRAGARPTGHGTRRSPSNLVMAAGDVLYAEMLRGIREGLLVHDFLGLGQGNPINGEFSVNVYLGYKIEEGQIVGRVKDVMLAGNAYAALKDIAAISREREWVSGQLGRYAGLLPYIQVGKLSVVAK